MTDAAIMPLKRLYVAEKLAAGADAYLLKPFKAKELVEKIDEMMQHPSGD